MITMKKTKQTLWSLAAVLLTCAVTVMSAFAEGSGWSSFRGNAENNGVTTAAPARTAEEAELKWSAVLKDSADWYTNISSSVIVNGVIYTAVGDQLVAYNSDGTAAGTLTLDGTVEYGVRLLAQGGTIFIPLPQGRVEAVDVGSMTKVWTSDTVENYKEDGDDGEGMEHQSLGTLTWHDGKLYLETACADWTTSYAGNILCLNAADGTLVWQHENTDAGYYWSGAVVKNGALIVAGDDAKLISLNAETGDLIDEIDLSAGVRSCVVSSGDSVYFSTCGGDFYAVPVNADGTFGTEQHVSFSTGSTSTPAIYDGKAYVGGSTGCFVIDLASMQVVQSAVLEQENWQGVLAPVAVQASPLAATGHSGSVYAYFTMNAYPGAIYAMELGSDAAEPTAVYTPDADKQNYCAASIIADGDGTLYYTNDSGTLFAVGVKLTSASSQTPSEPASSDTSSSAESVSSASSTAADGNSLPATGSAGAAAGAAVLFAGSLTCVLVLRKAKKDNQ